MYSAKNQGKARFELFETPRHGGEQGPTLRSV
jgi:hypothetical protein